MFDYQHTNHKALTKAAPYVALLMVLCVGPTHGLLAQHQIDVQRLSAEGEHFKALSVYELLPTRKVGTDTRIAAAKSSWALGLNRHAAEQFDVVLRDATLSLENRARITLSRGVLEYQEQRYPEASLYAEKTISYLRDPSPLRGRAFLLWGQSLSRTGAYGAAEEKLERALADADESDKAEINFALGMVEMRIGKLEKAEERLKAIPAQHDRSAAAVRALASIALQTNQMERARFWIEKGKSGYPEAFLDSWAEYGLMQIAVAHGDLPAARALVEEAQKSYPPSDSWLILMRAALEESEWSRKQLVEGN
jgi:tetratricopeptide (TPR) repeat protein